MAKNDEVRQNLIPSSKQYMNEAAAQADIANIPVGSTTYVRSRDVWALADEYMNNGGTLQPTGRKMPSQELVNIMTDLIRATFSQNAPAGMSLAFMDERKNYSVGLDEAGRLLAGWIKANKAELKSSQRMNLFRRSSRHHV